MIYPDFLKLLFSTASIERWNDQLRPVDFTEMDKQAHKMIIAWLLGRIEEEENATIIDWPKLIGYGVSEFAYRAVVTDLKPPVFHYLIKHKKRELDNYVESELDRMTDGVLKRRFAEYTSSSDEEPERRILGAAHFLASKWEFEIIREFRPESRDVREIWERIESELEEYLDLTGVRRLELGKKSQSFLETCAMLRFQKRWAKTPRIPQTSVLGHMLFVAVTSYLLSLEYGACDKKVINNFFAALFHDIAESLTRDIISPVKYGVEGLSGLLGEYEKKVVEERLMPMLPRYLREEMRYYITDEFDDKTRLGGVVKKIDDHESMLSEYNTDNYDGIDGTLLKVADHIGAYIEASVSISNGVSPQHLLEAKKNLTQRYESFEIYGIDIAALLKEL